MRIKGSKSPKPSGRKEESGTGDVSCFRRKKKYSKMRFGINQRGERRRFDSPQFGDGSIGKRGKRFVEALRLNKKKFSVVFRSGISRENFAKNCVTMGRLRKKEQERRKIRWEKKKGR